MELAAHFRLMFRFDTWANLRTLDGMATADPASVWADQGRVWFAHILWSQTLWLGRVRKLSGELPDVPGTLPLDDYRAMMLKLAEQWREFVEPLRAAQLAAPLTYRRTEGDTRTANLHAILAHVTNHGTHHRAQIATAIRRANGTPVAIDFIDYALENPADFEMAAPA